MMTLISRTFLKIKRCPWQTLILFLVISLLGTMTAGAISVNHAIIQTDLNLRRNLPAIATLIHDEQALDAYVHLNGYMPWDKFHALTPEVIETIGGLTYVRAFDYAILNGMFFSDELEQSRDIERYMPTGMDSGVLHENLALRWSLIEGLETFTLKGVYDLDVLDVETNLIQLLSGNVFSEIQSTYYPVLISEAFADTNGLLIDSTFMLEMRIYDFNQQVEHIQDHLLATLPLTFEVIGIFEPTVIMNEQATNFDIWNHMDLNARIYVPISVLRTYGYQMVELVSEVAPELALSFAGFDYTHVLFQLYDPLDLEAFNQATTELLPEFWLVDDLTNAFAPISASMEMMREIATMIVWIMVGLALLVLGLLITLFLHGSKQQIGIYLALGESKVNIMIQTLIETTFVAVFAIVLALFIGHIMGTHLSQTMLRNDLAVYEGVTRTDVIGGENDFVEMGFAIEMTVEEMLEAYSVSMNVSTVLMFLSVSIGMVILSTLMPIIYLLRLKPKDILMT